MSINFGVSVIICTWNRSALLRTTLSSLNEQTYFDKNKIEVIVVDNNSNDDTKCVVDEIKQTWILGELKYVFEPRQGKQFALNNGIQVSRFEILAFTDDDILFPIDWISKIIQLFKDKTLDLAGGKTILVWPDSGKPKWYDETMMAILAGVDLGNEKLVNLPPNYAPAGSNLIARRSLFDRVGGFSEVHFRHMDYEFGLRCAREGVSICYDPILEVFAPVEAACLTKRYFRRWSFKAGISEAGEETTDVTELFFVPRWVYRKVIEDSYFLLMNIFAHKDPAKVFSRELSIWRGLGTITSRWNKKFKPNSYISWVEKYSQKKKNLY